MNEAATHPELQIDPLQPGVLRGPVSAQRFNPWLLAAVLIHGALLTGLISSKPRQMGDPNSNVADAISVSLVSESEMRGDATVEDWAAGEPAPPPAPPPEASPATSQATPPNQPSAAETEKPAEQVPPDLKPALTPEQSSEPLDPAQPAAAKQADRQEEPTEKPAPKKPPVTVKAEKPPAKPQEAKPSKPKEAKTAKLDLSIPPTMLDARTGGRGAGVARPAGITRSGENDDFFRGVIRALQATMPQLRDTRGHVLVRITLNNNGNVVSTEVLEPSGVPGLDQSVVFATKQTNFPLPPNKAKPVDLIFYIRYNYI